MKSFKDLRESQDIKITESVMSDIHQMVGDKKTAAQIAKAVGIDVKVIQKLIKGMNEGKLPPHLTKFFDKDGELKKDAADRVRKGRIKKGLDPKTGQKLKEESVELDEGSQTFKDLESWVMAVVNAGGSISKRGNNLSGTGLGRTSSATFELKKGRGSMVESVELDEAAPKLKGNNGPYTRQQIEKAAKQAKVDISAAARMITALRKM